VAAASANGSSREDLWYSDFSACSSLSTRSSSVGFVETDVAVGTEESSSSSAGESRIYAIVEQALSARCFFFPQIK
jgi:hypothetical protein